MLSSQQKDRNFVKEPYMCTTSDWKSVQSLHAAPTQISLWHCESDSAEHLTLCWVRQRCPEVRTTFAFCLVPKEGQVSTSVTRCHAPFAFPKPRPSARQPRYPPCKLFELTQTINLKVGVPSFGLQINREHQKLICLGRVSC